MPLFIVRQDITKMETDAIVNAANRQLKRGGGVCDAIFKAAGAGKLQQACNKLAPIQTGEAVITPGFDLRAKYVIHAAGPVYSHWHKEQSARLLRSAYLQSLELAAAHGCDSVAFPLISSGIYGYPKDEALQVATEAISAFLAENEMEVYLVVFDRTAFLVSEQLLGQVKAYIDQNYVDEHQIFRSQVLELEERALAKAPDFSRPMVASVAGGKALDDLIADLDEPFSVALFHLIDSKGKTDVEVYKKANIDRKLFSKIRSVKGYTPKKPTILALSIALELSLTETDALLKRAGYALSHANKFDVIVEYFIVSGKYDIFEINQVLFQYDQPLLGGM